MYLLALSDRAWHLVLSNTDRHAQRLPVCQAWLSVPASSAVLADLSSIGLGQNIGLGLAAGTITRILNFADRSESSTLFLDGEAVEFVLEKVFEVDKWRGCILAGDRRSKRRRQGTSGSEAASRVGVNDVVGRAGSATSRSQDHTGSVVEQHAGGGSGIGTGVASSRNVLVPPRRYLASRAGGTVDVKRVGHVCYQILRSRKFGV